MGLAVQSQEGFKEHQTLEPAPAQADSCDAGPAEAVNLEPCHCLEQQPEIKTRTQHNTTNTHQKQKKLKNTGHASDKLCTIHQTDMHTPLQRDIMSQGGGQIQTLQLLITTLYTRTPRITNFWRLWFRV